MSDTLEDPLDLAWTRLESDWAAESRHKAFVHLAGSLGRLPEAARRYRSLVDDPERGAQARFGLDEVLRTAMAMLTPPPRDERPSRGMWLIPLATLAMLVLLTLFIAATLRRPGLVTMPVFGGEVFLVAILPWNRIVRRR